MRNNTKNCQQIELGGVEQEGRLVFQVGGMEMDMMDGGILRLTKPPTHSFGLYMMILGSLVFSLAQYPRSLGFGLESIPC